MSYQVLARKWRPEKFDDVSGQSHVTTPLRNAIGTGRIPHAILLTGPRGVGKTTIARILARCLNCEKGPTADPCGTCPSCLEIASGHSTDVQEIDAASRTSVDDVREIIESVRYAPSPGKHRIYVVDEVHMLSTAAFNALLKTLEEPPPRSLFVFATTNPEKIPFTVVSRCQRYDLRRIPMVEAVTRLREVAESEGVTLSDTSLRELARAGEGSLRDSMTLLDQVIAVGGTEVSDAQVAEILDLIDTRVLLAILEACIERDPKQALVACARAADAGVEPKRLGAALASLLRDLVALRIAPDAGLVEGSDDEIDVLRTLAERTEAARLRRMFRALVKEHEDLTWAPEPMAVLEMAVVRLATLPDADDLGALIGRLEKLEHQLSGQGPGPGGNGSGGTPGPEAGGPKRRGRAASSGGSEASARATASPQAPPAPAGEPTAEATEVASSAEEDEALDAIVQAGPPGEPAEAPVPVAPASPPAHSDSATPAQVYDRLRAFAQEQNRGLYAGLEGGRILGHENGLLRVWLPRTIGARRLRERLVDLEAVCANFFGRPTRVELQVEEGSAGAAESRADAEARARRLRKEVLNHPAVNVALEVLEAEIVEIRQLGGDAP